MIAAEQLDQAEALAERVLQAKNRSTDIVVQLASCILVLVRELRQVRKELSDARWRLNPDSMGG